MPTPFGYALCRQLTRTVRLFCLGAFLLTCHATLQSHADVLRLRNGINLEGEWLNPNETPLNNYIFKTPEGTQVTFAAEEVEKVTVPSDLDSKYLRAVAKMPETAAAHWKMYEICRSQKMQDRADFHLRQVVRLDPDHKEARNKLGYTKDEQGRWVTQDEFLEKGGYVYRGRSWVTQQESELLEYLEQTDNARRQWKHDLQRWRRQLDGRAGAEAQQNILSINDPAAIESLSWLLGREDVPQYRRWYLEVLNRFVDNGATQALVNTALQDPDQEVRELCVGYLKGDRQSYAIVAATSSLKGNEPALINRAAYLLEQLNGQSGIRQLINALTVTKHTIVNTPGTQAGFEKGGGGGLGFSQGGGKVRHTEVFENTGVLEALRTMTEQDFGYDKSAWRAWYIQSQTPAQVNLRRDP
ncbi:MAG: hypothetical protein O2931_05815 [Planctomycetota bacterium]|nr:hypothetical protein [Planctomycetota bacterium]MDA1178300.1 hypothetical protein [Planctomycetota bacterium]